MLGCGQSAHDHLTRVLKLRGRTLAEVQEVLAEYANAIEPEPPAEGAPSDRPLFKDRVAGLVARLLF